MSEEPSEALRRALNEMEVISKRSLLVTRLTLYPSVVCFTACILMLLFSQNKWLGLAWGIMSLYALIGALGVYISGRDHFRESEERIADAGEVLWPLDGVIVDGLQVL